MKHLCLFVLMILPFMVAGQDTAQASLTVFSADGNPFYLYIDGVRKNDTPRKEVRVDGINDLYCQVRLDFANAQLGSVTRNRLAVSDGEDNPMDATYKVVRQNNTVKLRFYSMNPVGHKKGDKHLINAMSPTADNPSGCLTVFSEQGENFFLYLNGIQQNSVAQSRIRVDGLPDLFYQVKLVFADPKIPAFNKNSVAISDGDDQLMDAVYKVSRSASNTRLRFYAMNPVVQSPVIQQGTSQYHWGSMASQEKPVIMPVAANKNNAVAVVPAQPLIKTIPEKKKPVKEDKPSQVSKPAVNDKPVVSQEKPVEQKPAIQKDQLAKSTLVHEPTDWVCANEWPMWKADYSAARKNIESVKDDTQRLAITDKLLSTNCFNTDQVIDLARLFNKEETRYQFVQSAFRHTIDYKNYYRVLTVFQTESVKSKLSAFLRSNSGT